MQRPVLRNLGAMAVIVIIGAGPTSAAEPARGIRCDLPSLGRLAVRPARDIEASPWSIGGETLDRDFAVYANYKKYLGPLGAKAIRLQAGWAKTETQPGQYQWGWLDEIIDDAIAQGVRPWLELSYGNPIYPGGGGTDLGGGLPTSPEALAAWDRWTRELVRRYRNRVNEWEIWNEPDINKNNSPEDYVELYIRTAEIIRAEQPQSRILALALAGNLAFAERFLEGMKKRDKLGLIDVITVHGYRGDPDDISLCLQARKLAGRFSPSIEIRQGENGAPSTSGTFGALRNRPWSELTQAKWNLRRMLAHRAADIPFSLFTLMELAYRKDGRIVMNTKGLLKANPDLTVAYPKPAYFAAQHVFSIFDDSWRRIPNVKFEAHSKQPLALSAYQRGEDGPKMVALWLSNGPPAEENERVDIVLTLSALQFDEPVLVDLLEGRVYQIPSDRVERSEKVTRFLSLPVYDSPILIVERKALSLEESRK